MGKPNDLPQDVWEAAEDAYEFDDYSQQVLNTAKAILAERRRCASLALPRIHHRHTFHLRKAIHDQIMKGDSV